MPRKATAKKASSQRTFRLPMNVASAFDAVCEHFEESADRVARRFLEDGLRSIAREHSLEAVLELLGEKKANPFEFDAASYAPPPVPSMPFALNLPARFVNPYETAPSENLLPGGGPPLPVLQEAE
jgi:hypothetical protein